MIALESLSEVSSTTVLFVLEEELSFMVESYDLNLFFFILPCSHKTLSKLLFILNLDRILIIQHFFFVGENYNLNLKTKDRCVYHLD